MATPASSIPSSRFYPPLPRRGSLPFSLLPRLSLSLSLSFPCRPPTLPTYLRPYPRASAAAAAVAVYYGNFEPIRKSIATRRGERARPRRPASRRARRASQARLFPCLRNCGGWEGGGEGVFQILFSPYVCIAYILDSRCNLPTICTGMYLLRYLISGRIAVLYLVICR